MKHTITVQTDVQVEVDLRKFPTEILMDELKDREEMRLHNKLKAIALANDRFIDEAGENHMVYIPPLNSEDQHPLHGIYYAMKFGKKEHAVDLMRDYLCEQFGVVL